MANLNEGILGQLPIALPSSTLQQGALLASLDSRLAALREVEVAASESVLLLQERRTALISAAVTGKIDVRHLAVASTEPAPEPA